MFLNEKLDPQEEEQVKSWDSERPEHTQSAIDSVFGHQSRLEFPLPNAEVVPHPDVEQHLSKHGITITNYLDNKAKDKYNRETTIGRALQKSKAPTDVVNAFENDPQRQQNKSGLKVVISHHPYDVAGMTSGHQSWINQSCMNFNKGSMRTKLKDDVKEGTHVAYLTDENDTNLDRPVARVAIKPFHSQDGHTIFRAEDRVYGNAGSVFNKSVNDWLNKKYPAKEDTLYKKNRNVYNDTGMGDYFRHSKESLDHIARGGNNEYTINPSDSQYVVKKVISEQKKNPDSKIINNFLISNGHHISLDIPQANQLFSSAIEHNQSSAARALSQRHGDVLSQENLRHALNIHVTHTPRSLLRNRYLPDHIVDSMDSRDYRYLHPSKITPELVDKAFENYKAGKHFDSPVVDIMSGANKENLLKIANNKTVSSDMINAIMNHPKADKEVTDTLFNNAVKGNDIDIGYVTSLLKHPTPEHVAKINKDHTGVLANIMENAKDELTHRLAFNKIIDSGANNKPVLTKNSNQFMNDEDIANLHKHIYKFNSTNIDNTIHSRLLNHIMDKVDTTHEDLKYLQDKYGENSEDADFAKHRIKKLLTDHSDLISRKISKIHNDVDDRVPFDGDYATKGLLNHINRAISHPAYDQKENTHMVTESEHHMLMKSIENNHRW